MAGAAGIACSTGLSSRWSTIQSSAARRHIGAEKSVRTRLIVRFGGGRSSGVEGGRKFSEQDCSIGWECRFAGGYVIRKDGGGDRRQSTKFLPFVPHAVVKQEESEQVSVQDSPNSPLKELLEDLKSVGRVRLIVNTGVAVLESVTSLDKLYYHQSARGEYANIMCRDDNVDFHLLLEKVVAARLVNGKSKSGDIPTCTVRFMDVHGAIALSIFVMWRLGTNGEYDPGQLEAFQILKEKYGEELQFSNAERNLQ